MYGKRSKKEVGAGKGKYKLEAFGLPSYNE